MRTAPGIDVEDEIRDWENTTWHGCISITLHNSRCSVPAWLALIRIRKSCWICCLWSVWSSSVLMIIPQGIVCWLQMIIPKKWISNHGWMTGRMEVLLWPHLFGLYKRIYSDQENILPFTWHEHESSFQINWCKKNKQARLKALCFFWTDNSKETPSWL